MPDSEFKITKQPLKWYGGKFYLADWIIGLMPRHLTYIEPYAGGLAVLMRKDPMDKRHRWGMDGSETGKSEIVNDVHGGLTNFWKVLQNVDAFSKFQRIIEATPFCKQIWEESEALMMPNGSQDLDVDAAVAFFVRCRQSRAGACKSFVPMTRKSLSSGMEVSSSSWLKVVENLPEVHDRLKRVVIFNESAIKVIKREDDWKTLFYLDPPYVGDTRVETKVYKYEMTVDDHKELLDVANDCEAFVMISGYRSTLYDDALKKWTRHDKETTSGSSDSHAKRLESLWCNFELDSEGELI